MAAYVSGDFCSVFCTNNSVNMCQVILNIQRVEVKGYDECPFSVEVGKGFVAQPEERRFVHFGSTVTGSPVNDVKGRWRPGGGINVPVRIEITLPKQQANEIRRTV